jgi:SAM-dependent methyltransferase
VASDIVAANLAYYDISASELSDFIALHERQENWDDQDRVNEALQHVVRDWSDEGLHERAVPLAALTKLIDTHFPDRDNDEGPVRILVPGSGLGRLAHAVAALPGVEVTANEWSAYMRAAYHYVESLQIPNAETFHPFMDWWSYQPNRGEMIRSVRFPDVRANASSVVLVEGDFTKAFADDSARFDAIVTFFFIDTAPNMMDYLDTVHRLLRPGGVWINLGPLLYHEATVEFSLEDVVRVAEEYGFEFLDVDDQWGELTLPHLKVRSLEIAYQYHAKSLRRNDYMAQLFVAVKKE